MNFKCKCDVLAWADPQGDRGSGPSPPPPHTHTPLGKSQVIIGFLRNTGTDPIENREAIGPHGSNCFSMEVHTAVCEIR